ncbi:MAG: hypothetical protein ACRC2H_01095 [Silanimonas sp.]
MRWESVDYRVASFMLPAIINGDHTGLTDEESDALDALLESEEIAGRQGHWAETNPKDIEGSLGKCDVCGKHAIVSGVSYIYRAEEQSL